MNLALRLGLGCLDLLFRIRNKVRRYFLGKTVFSASNLTSDSEGTFYVDVVRRSLSRPNIFRNFRRNFDYREILEHVSYSLGLKYLTLGTERNSDFLKILEKSRRIDEIGNPIRFDYRGVGLFSPTLIRYAYVASDMRRIFDFDSIDKIVEIGSGYGGQSAVLQSIQSFSDYTVYDLPEVTELTKKFIYETNFNFKCTIGNLESTCVLQSDLLISNYAFSELPRSIQELYLDKVITKAQRGYMIMNSGRTNHTGRSAGKMTLTEIAEYLPGIHVIEEDPLTSLDNYIIYWDYTKLVGENA
jgi:hypothetical protein